MLPINSTTRKRAVSHSSYQVGHHHRTFVHEPLPSSSAQPTTPPHSLPRSDSRHPYVPHNTPDRILPPFASLHNLSAQSSPVTSPSSAHASSSRFTDSQSSFTSESASAITDPRSVFEDNRVSATSSRPYFGTPSSPATSGRSRSITESDLLPIHGVTRKRASKCPSSPRPRAVPDSPNVATLETPESPVAMGIKFLLSKPALSSPTRLSGPSLPSRPPTPPKPRPHPHDLPLPGYSHPDHPTRAITSPSTSPPFISQDSLSLSTNSVPTKGKDQKQRNVLRRKPSAKVKERIQREMELRRKLTSASPSHYAHDSASKDTSLSAVQPYKERHDGSSAQPTEEPSEPDPRSPSPIPYYTVYGTQSEFRITAGGPDDNRNWSLHAHVLAEQRAQTLHSDPSRSLSRKGSLSRRVSSKWKKATGGGVKAGESPLREPSIGRSSFQDGHSFCSLNDRGQFTNAGESAKGHIRSATDLQGKSEGSKIWKLMKRISTGGLRERFHVDTTAPPVPAIPKELLNTPPPRSQTVQTDAQATSHRSYSVSMPRSIAGSGPRPSMATSSSSPNSSEIASASFFRMSHSRGSSVSSYGEETVPRLPSMGDRHIVSPRELHQILGDYTEVQGTMSHSGRPSNSSDRSSSSGRSYSGRATPTAEGKGDDQQETSPRIHTSPITHPIHSLTSLRTRRLVEKPSTAAHTHLLPDGNTSLSPPPRPARGVACSRRLSESKHLPSQSTFTTTDEKSNSRISLRAPSTLSDASTAKIQTRSRSSTSASKDSSSSQHRSAVNYRELKAARPPPLTEREKADIWDDLLKRSAQAGGTLHLGGGGELESDNLRFSGYSELS